jgi:hypothetical protein
LFEKIFVIVGNLESVIWLAEAVREREAKKTLLNVRSYRLTCSSAAAVLPSCMAEELTNRVTIHF